MPIGKDAREVRFLQPGMRIRVGHDVEVAVFGINRFQVRIGISAPMSKRIRRLDQTEVQETFEVVSHWEATSKLGSSFESKRMGVAQVDFQGEDNE